MPSLFISYRRGDSPDTVKLIYERLKKRLPRWEIFYDHDSISLGEQFPERVRAKVAAATAVLVVVGPKWVEILHERKNASIDHVREEVRLALETGASVVPVLAVRAAMPTDADLADFADLRPLLKRNGRPVRPDPDFDSDLEPIVAHLKSLDSAEAVGTILDDKYTLTQYIDEGGMGVVYAAQQKKPVQRVVAVKLIKPGMDSRDVLARFDAERQALAVMDHPNVAKVLDAGMTPHGRPYFVMEYVKGVPITQYCDDKKLTPQERLNLFIPVCNAVQHAHQKGIIHRDLKPSNVLVEVVDGKPVPKVIDFGLAKALGQKLTDKTLHTALEMRVGTLEYSAPEQAAGRSFDVDTRSDIYSLGVLLYELLTGAPPFTHEELLKIGEEEMRRVIRDVEPTTPSKKLSSSGELPAIAAKRHLEPGKLTRMVQGDLDWIVMKCLEKENGRRYETANQLGEELQRFLCDEPVLAGPPSVRYRAGKFLRRNKGPMFAAALVSLALVCGIIGTSIQYFRAELARADEATQRELAEANEAKAKKARAVAEERLAQLEKSENLLVAILRESNLAMNEDGTPNVHSTLRPAIAMNTLAIDKILQIVEQQNEANIEPKTLAKLYFLIGSSYCDNSIVFDKPKRELGMALLNKARARQETLLGPDHPHTLVTANQIGAVYLTEGRVKEALAILESAFQKGKGKLGVNHQITLRTLYLLALAYKETGQVENAFSLLAIAVSGYHANPQSDHQNRQLATYTLVTWYEKVGRFEEALPVMELYIRNYEHVPGPPGRYDFMFEVDREWLARLYEINRQPDKAANLYETAFKELEGHEWENYTPPQRPGRHIDLMEKAGSAQLAAGNLPRAIELAHRCMKETADVGSDQELKYWLPYKAKLLLGVCLLAQKKNAEAAPLIEEGYKEIKKRETTFDAYQRRMGVTQALERLVQLYDATGNAAEAERWRKELAARKAAQKEPKK